MEGMTLCNLAERASEVKSNFIFTVANEAIISMPYSSVTDRFSMIAESSSSSSDYITLLSVVFEDIPRIYY
jgi:hypothetical protein